MRLDESSQRAIRSPELNTNVEVRFVFDAQDFVPWSKISLSRHLFVNRRVINVGCGDHGVTRLEQKQHRSEWLHGHLDETTKLLVGVDSDPECVSFINSRSIKGVYCLDILSDYHPVLSAEYDAMLIPDSLEHQIDPVRYLTIIRERYRDNIDKLFVTVPNALASINIRYSRMGRELINASHNFAFTPFTLIRTLFLAGFECEEIYMMNDVSDRRYYPALSAMLRSTIGRRIWIRRLLNQRRIGVVATFR